MSGLSDEDRDALTDALTTPSRLVCVVPGGALERAVEAIVARAVSAALNEAADNMPVSRSGRPYEHAASWLRRRAEAINDARTT